MNSQNQNEHANWVHVVQEFIPEHFKYYVKNSEDLDAPA